MTPDDYSMTPDEFRYWASEIPDAELDREADSGWQQLPPAERLASSLPPASPPSVVPPPLPADVPPPLPPEGPKREIDSEFDPLAVITPKPMTLTKGSNRFHEEMRRASLYKTGLYADGYETPTPSPLELLEKKREIGGYLLTEYKAGEAEEGLKDFPLSAEQQRWVGRWKKWSKYGWWGYGITTILVLGTGGIR